MKRIIQICLPLIFAAISMQSVAQKEISNLWKDVQKYEKKGLPQSALTVVDSIYELSIQKEYDEDLLKAIVYRMKLNNYYQENQLPGFIKSLNQDAERFNGEMKAFTHVLIAKMYMMYYSANSWQISQRTNTGAFAEDDMETWTSKNFHDAIIESYKKALSEPDLLYSHVILEYPELINQDSYGRIIQPTLLDFIIHDAVNSLTRPISYYDQSSNDFLKSADFFQDARLFIYKTIELENQDRIEAAMSFLQLLMKTQKSDKYIYSQVYTDLRRLSLVKEKSDIDNDDKLYFDALLALREKHKASDDNALAQIEYALAVWYQQQGEDIIHVPGDTNKAAYLDKAVRLSEKIVDKYLGSRASKQAEVLLRNIKQKRVSFTMKDYIISDTHFPIRIEYNNFKTLHVNIFRLDPNTYREIYRNNYGEKRMEKLRKAGELVRNEQIELPGEIDYVMHSTEYVSEPMESGFYYIWFSTEPLDAEGNIILEKSFTVTNFAWLTDTYSSKDKLNVFVTDRQSGHPMKDVKVTMYNEKYNYRISEYEYQKISSGKTNKDGQFSAYSNDDYSSYFFKLETKDESVMTNSVYYSRYRYNTKTQKQTKTHLFTDRAVYRPGQTIHVKGICVSSLDKQHDIMPNFTTSIYLYDANRQQIGQKSVKTNEFGSFTVDFDIPTGLLNGNLQIKVGSSSKNVRLEEYKRPSFEVKLNDFDGNYKLNQSVKIQGEAITYSAAKITDAKLKYRIFAQPKFQNVWRYYYLPQKRELLSYGDAVTDENGEFSIDFTAKALPGYPVEQDVSFSYSIEVDVTDMTGETQSDSKQLTVGYRSLLMSTNFSTYTDVSDLDSVTIITQNLNFQPVKAHGSLVIFELIAPEELVHKRLWGNPEFHMLSEDEWKNNLPNEEYDEESNIRNYPVGDRILSLNFDTKSGNKFAIPNSKQLKPGVYKIEIRAKDAFGLPVIEKEYIRISDKQNNSMANDVPLKIQINHANGVYSPGDEIQISFGSGVKNAMAHVIIEHEDKMLFRGWLNLGKNLEKRTFFVDESLRGGISVSAYLITEGHFYTKSRLLSVPYTNKQIEMEFLHFRDEVLPGAKEEIIISLRGHKGEKLAAEMLATMYDESLDVFYVNSFAMRLFYPQYPSHNIRAQGFNYGNAGQLLYSYKSDPINIKGSEPNLNLFGMNYYGAYYLDNTVETSGRRVMMPMGSAKVTESKKEEALFSAVTVSKDGHTDQQPMAKAGERADADRFDTNETGVDKENQAQQQNDPEIRTNFNETAFFFPQLRTDENGDIKFSFTTPESLTRWKFLALSHTKDLKTGVTENQMTTKKQLMISPNMPRFFREGDKMSLQVKISNLSEQAQTGQCEIKLIDVMTGNDVTNTLLSHNSALDFAVESGQNTSVQFNLEIPLGLQAIEYELIAKSGSYGDGERRVIPVLSNRMLVTESMPMYVNGNSTKTWRFEKLLNAKSGGSMKHHQLSLEMTPRPAWYAIQALPYLMEYPYECSEQIFSRFYANSLASHIANSDLQIQRIFEAWKAIPESDALKSNLHKNEDLKAVMLQQTPWVLQADNEAERKRRVGVLFDMERMSNELYVSLIKLEKRQKGNGAWPWFDGMPENRYITQHIVAGMAHLKHLGVLDADYTTRVDKMMRHAAQYLDNQILEDYQQLKRWYDEEEMNELRISHIQVHYLYTRSFIMDIASVNPAAAKAYQYYYEQAQKYWVEMNYYSKAMIALAMYRTDSEQLAADIVASLKEYAIVDDEMGMYWKSGNGYFWYQAPIETQALLIEAFDEITQDNESVKRMKQWLLNQKRTQDWKTTKATTEAVYALILTGSNLLDLSSNVVVEIGGEVYNPQNDSDVKSEAGTGYFRKNWHAGEIKPEMGEVKLTKTGDGMAWGALHWQYF
ncbi:MAG: alpha-2-macroglobulin family protein, partial [Bacteroidota bacterium]|nr:alpha-2-macroglobulin family protein [Bacteroidota bacterium]